jgi:carbonic anhydrase/acetyltransferase-like protein (isoleucine patch superfamily)
MEQEHPPVWQRLDRYLSQTPVIDPSAYVAPGATLIGAVTLGARSSVWYQTVVLGSPARVIRELTEGEAAGIHALAQKYVGVARRYREGGADSKPS